jgi:hypothetical protein
MVNLSIPIYARHNNGMHPTPRHGKGMQPTEMSGPVIESLEGFADASRRLIPRC